MFVLEFDYVARSAQAKYKRDLESCMHAGKVQPDKLAEKIMEINERLGDGYGGMIGHNLDKVKSFQNFSDKNAVLFTQCLVLALTLQSLVIYGRSQNFDIARYCQEAVLNGSKNNLTADTDPDRYITLIRNMKGALTHEGLSANFMRETTHVRHAIDGALYGVLHPALKYAFDKYLNKDEYHRTVRQELENFFTGQAKDMWEGRKCDIPVLIRKGQVVEP